MGFANKNIKNYDQAIKLFKKALEIKRDLSTLQELVILNIKQKNQADSYYYMDQAVQLFYKQKKDDLADCFSELFYSILELGEFNLVDKAIIFIEEKKEGLQKQYANKINFQYLHYFKILIRYLKTKDSDILDRQPQEIKKTLQEMIDFFTNRKFKNP